MHATKWITICLTGLVLLSSFVIQISQGIQANQSIPSYGTIRLISSPQEQTYFRCNFEKYWDPHISDNGGSGVLTGENNICEVGQWDWADWRTTEGTWVQRTNEQFYNGQFSAKFSLLTEGPRPLDHAQHCKLFTKTENWGEEYKKDRIAYYSAYYWFPSEFKVDSWRLIMQWGEPYEPRPTFPTVSLVFQGAQHKLMLHNKEDYNPDGVSRNWWTGYTAETIPKNRWVKVVVYMTISSAFRVTDGVGKVWIDDELVVETNELANHGQNDIDFVWSIGNYGGVGEAYGQHIYIDNVVVSSDYIVG